MIPLTLNQANEVFKEAIEQHSSIGEEIFRLCGQRMTRTFAYQPQSSLQDVVVRLREIADSVENDNMLLAIVKKNQAVQSQMRKLDNQEASVRIGRFADDIRRATRR